MVATMTAPHRAPVVAPRFGAEGLDRSQDALLRALREQQNRVRRFTVTVAVGDSSAAIPEWTVLDAYAKLRIVGVWWDSSGALAASGTDYWTFLLREREDGGATRIIGRFSTASDALVAFRRRHFEPLVNPVIQKGRRVTLEIAETGTATARPRGSLVMVVEEVD